MDTPVEPQVQFIMSFYPLEDSGKVVGACREYIASAPDELMMVAVYGMVPPAPEIDEKDHGKDAVIVLGCYSGPLEDAAEETDKLRKITEPIVDLSSAMEWKVIQTLMDADYPNGMFYYWKSIYLDRLDDEVIRVLDQFAKDRPSKETTINIYFVGGAMNRVTFERSFKNGIEYLP